MDEKITRKVLHNLMNIIIIMKIMILVIALKLLLLYVRVKVKNNINEKAVIEVIITHFKIDLCSLLSL